MVDRLLALKESVSSDIITNENCENLSTAEWKLAHGFTNILKPVAEATEIASGEKYPTRSLVIPLIIGIFDILQKFIATPSNKNCGIMFTRRLI